MLRLLLPALLALIPMVAFADGVPERINLDQENADALGFHLVAEVSGDGSSIRVVTANFPKALEPGCEMGRVQSFLFDLNGEQVSGMSSDYRSADEAPVVLAHYDFQRFDMALVFQYLCDDGIELGYRNAYTIDSLNEFLVTRRSSAGTPQDGAP